MPWNPPLTALRNRLADLFATPEDARRVVEEAQLDPAHINFATTAINHWHSILHRADLHNKVEALVEVALREYANDAEVLAAYQAYRAAPGQPTALLPAGPPPESAGVTVPAPLLAHPRHESGPVANPLAIEPAAARAANPFGEILAIRDPARFIGRRKELARLQALLTSGSVALLGEPKIGKSSLLWQLTQRWPGAVIGPIDCHVLESTADFYGELAQQLALTNAAWPTLRTALQERAALLLLDEFDSAPDWGMNSEHLRRFRSLCDHNRQLHLVTTSRKPLKELFPDGGRGSPAYNFLLPLTLSDLEPTEASQLLAHPWLPNSRTFDSITCATLLNLAGNHPFRLQRAAFHRYEHLGDADYPWQTAYQQDLDHLQ